MDYPTVLNNMALSLLFAVLGFALMFLAYKVYDWITPRNLGKLIFEESNLAAAIALASVNIGIALIVASAIH